MARRKGTVSLVGLPPGDFPMPIFDVVLKRITVRGSIVGTPPGPRGGPRLRRRGDGRAHIHHATLEDINDVFARFRTGQVDGSMVLDIAAA